MNQISLYPPEKKARLPSECLATVFYVSVGGQTRVLQSVRITVLASSILLPSSVLCGVSSFCVWLPLVDCGVKWRYEVSACAARLRPFHTHLPAVPEKRRAEGPSGFVHPQGGEGGKRERTRLYQVFFLLQQRSEILLTFAAATAAPVQLTN